MRMEAEEEVEKEYLWPEGFLQLLEKVSQRLPLPPPEQAQIPPIETLQPADLEGKKITGVDGSHNGKELAGFYFGVAVAMAYTSDWRVISDPSPIFEGDIFRLNSVFGDLWLSLQDVHLVFTVAKRAVEERRPDWLIVDGPLLLYPSLIPRYIFFSEEEEEIREMDLDRWSSYKTDLYRCADTVLEFFRTCRERRVNVLGLVKRVRSSLFDTSGRRRDASILQKHLGYGQVTQAVAPGKHPSLRLYAKRAKEAGFQAEVGWEDFFKVVYLRSSRVKPPVRLEVPYWVNPRQAAEAVLALSDPISGVPVHILRVEGLIRMGDEILKSIYLRMLGKSATLEDLMPLHGEEFLAARWEVG
jgi:hypothetical protein